MKHFTLDDLTVERVKVAYEKTGLKPSSVYIEGEQGCALQVMALSIGLKHWGDLEDGKLYDPEVLGFIHGFDGFRLRDGESEKFHDRGATIAMALGVRRVI